MQHDLSASTPKYPAIQFLLRYGNAVAIVFGLLPLLLAAALVAGGAPFVYGIAGIVAAGFAYLLMRSYVELVAVIADMLLPK